MADVYINLSQLEQVVAQIEAIVNEFDDATSLSEELEAAIGDPFGRSALRDKARDFEERWDDKRGKLKDGLTGVKEHVEGVIKGVEQWDSDTAIQLSSS